MQIKLVLLATAALLCGCSHIKSIGKIGHAEVFKIQGTSLLGPTITALAIKEGNEITLLQPFGGNGILPGLVGGSALVGSSYLFGHSLRPDATSVNQNASGSVDVDVRQRQGQGQGQEQVVKPQPAPMRKPMKHGWD